MNIVVYYDLKVHLVDLEVMLLLKDVRSYRLKVSDSRVKRSVRSSAFAATLSRNSVPAYVKGARLISLRDARRGFN